MASKESVALVLIIILLIMPAVPARGSGLAACDAQISGPMSVKNGDRITLVISVSQSLEGFSADIETSGLVFKDVSSKLCEPHGLVLLPSMGTCSVTYTYEVAADTVDRVALRLQNVTVSRHASSEAGPSREWSAPLERESLLPEIQNQMSAAVGPAGESTAWPLQPASPGTPATGNPCNYIAAAMHAAAGEAPVSCSPDSISAAGPAFVYSGDVVQIVLRLDGFQAYSASLHVAGLSLVRSSIGTVSAQNIELYPVPGLDAAVCTFRIVGEAGSTAALRTSRNHLLWSAPIRAARLESLSANLNIQSFEASQRLVYLIYDTEPQVGITLSSVRADLSFPANWHMVLDRSKGVMSDHGSALRTGDRLIFRNQEHGRILDGVIVLRGDLNGSGQIDIAQVARLAKLLSRTAQAGVEEHLAGDLNHNGLLDIGDLTFLAGRLAAGSG